jgi:NAD(P)-dependent dehydrogenase (short-subunit alcohol dehydrogenase family)
MAFSIVTGANRGIGLSLVAALGKRGHTVLAACRKSSPELARLGAEVVEGVDVATERGIAALVGAVRERSIDLLVNNAGILVWGDRLGQLNVSGIREQFEVNALAPLLVTDACARSSRAAQRSRSSRAAWVPSTTTRRAAPTAIA